MVFELAENDTVNGMKIDIWSKRREQNLESTAYDANGVIFVECQAIEFGNIWF